LYVVNPVDLVPDVPGVGWLDDLVVVGLLLWFLSGVRRAPAGGMGEGTAEQKGDTASADPYTVLGVDRRASPDEIRAAYRRMVAQYHPDKVSHLGKEFQEMAHQKLIAIQQAYEVLMPRGNPRRG
jgi:DnaJ like chaperone protein